MKRPLEPSSRLSWWAFWLGFATGFWGRILLTLPELLGTQLPVRLHLEVAGVALEAVLILAALVTGVLAFKKGERSWLNLVAFVLALAIGGLWLFFALGPR